MQNTNKIRLYTTPTYIFTVEGIDLSEADVYVTFKQNDTILTFNPTATYADNVSTMEVAMTQAETGRLKPFPLVQVQINWMLNGDRNATNVEYIIPNQNLIDEVITGE